MKIKVIKQAWYKNSLLKEGAEIDYPDEKIPSWAVSLEPVKPKTPPVLKVSDLEPEEKEEKIKTKKAENVGA